MEDQAVNPKGSDLGATLLGGLVGAAIGIGLHLALEVGAEIEAPWFAILTGLATGLGVRQATKSFGPRVSYARGALTSLIALAAIVATYPLKSMALDLRSGAAKQQQEDAAQAEATADAAPDEAAADDEAADEAAAAGEPAAPGATTADATAGAGTKRNLNIPRSDFNLNQFLFMALGALVAYPLGRGSDPAAEGAAPEEPVAMDPSN